MLKNSTENIGTIKHVFERMGSKQPNVALDTSIERNWGQYSGFCIHDL